MLGPILVLSYKNHALDEFLCDVIKFQPSFKKPGALIRTGKAENEIMSSFSERHNPLETSAQNELTTRLSVQRNARKIAFEWREMASDFETLCYQVLTNLI